MSRELRVALDTNVIVSALLRPQSMPRQAFDHCLAKGQLLISEATLRELDVVLRRPKFQKYLTLKQRLEFLAALLDEAELIEITERLRICRDANDDKFLELIVSGKATHLITGDADLLELHPFRGVAVFTPQRFLELCQTESH
jgi:putative PIN family toxin of toxin-antitoxin system